MDARQPGRFARVRRAPTREASLKLGLNTAPFPKLSLEQVAEWAAGAGFEALEVCCWPAGAGEERRYAGITHVDVESLDEAKAASIRAMLASHGLEISALGYYPNNLHPDPTHRAAVNEHTRRVIAAARTLGVGTVCTFVGRDPSRSLPDSLAAFREVWPPLVRAAEEHGVRIAIENCPMIFGYDEWPGGTNLAYSPAVWREMFDVIPSGSFGLNFDPSHLVWQMIDWERAIYEFADRIFHVHAKDMEVRRDGLYDHGVMSVGMGWQVPRLPGLGEVRWDRFLSALYAVGYDGHVVVEHEDRGFEGTEELVKRGFEIARNALRPLIV
jgi:sugar phosphate isomerase/epimerase